jgi:peptidoglycan/LPS O-acetylase OafA/YrhL
VIIAAGFLLALGYNTPVFPFLYQYIPTFNMFNAPARYLIWPLFGLSLLASIGVSRWRTPAGRGLYWLRLATAGGFAITLGAFLALYFLRDVRPTFIYATALAGVWGLGAGLLTLFMPAAEQQSRRFVWQWLVVIWIGLDLLVAGWNHNPTIEMDFYRNHPDVGM